jgi:methyl acetate hydrolase
MTLDTVIWIASMTKAITGAAAMQLVEQRPARSSMRRKWSACMPELARVRKCWRASTASGAPKHAAGEAPHHPAPPAHPHRRIRLRHRGTRPIIAQLHGAWPCIPGIVSCQNRALTTPLLLRSGRRLALRHRHRLGRQGGREGRAACTLGALPPGRT